MLAIRLGREELRLQLATRLGGALVLYILEANNYSFIQQPILNPK